MSESEKKKQHNEDILNAGIAGASYDTVQRFGSAVKEHFVAYSGRDNEFNNDLVKGLKQISKENVNPEYRFQNIHQQAGFSAEVKEVARSNAENIINNDPTRKIRTDDLGDVNDQLYDTALLDADGNVIKGSKVQVKFLGASENDPDHLGDAARALDKLQSKKFQKYLDNDVKIDVPSDQYDQILQEANSKIEDLSKQLNDQAAKGKTEEVAKIREQIDKLEKIKHNLGKSKVSSDEAVFAREHPELSTAIDVAKIANQAGLETAKNAAIIGGSISIVKNLVAVSKGEEDLNDALKNVAKDTAKKAAVGYGTGFAGAAIKGAMQNSGSEYMRAVSKTNVPGTVVTVTVMASKTLTRYFKGEIDGVECLETLGEQGTGMLSSAMFAAIGQVAIPVPVVGAMIGSMVGYSFSSAAYGILTESLKDAKMAKEERKLIEKTCEEHINMIREYRSEMEKIINEYLSDSMDVFRESFSGIKNALAIGDVDWFIDSANTITEYFGGMPSFSSMDDFNNKMLSGSTFKL